ncbi:hypothetical protein GIB67_024046 [Kingdonia uniflora]|uniref:Pentatricopeptide repeat-containing protein n=1 Tax=Kingdonia uniflora TaxID=39325 RepID=A0A7J7LB43_9MAGN|nr:hypothetical protein GIB67_024046 [Kingdonia uniflora]
MIKTSRKLLATSPTNIIPLIKNLSPWAQKPNTQTSLHTFPKGPSILATNLIVSYCTKGLLKEAHQLFDEIPERDVVAWTAMISGYTSSGHCSQSWDMFGMMMGSDDVSPNSFTVSSVLKACKEMECYYCGVMVHGLAIKYGVDGSIYVDNALMDMYVTCGDTMDDACVVFKGIRVKNVVSWTTMIAGYTHRGDGFRGLHVFRDMLQEEVELNSFSWSISIRACASIGSKFYGEQIHSAVVKHGFETNVPIGNSLVDMYCRCNSLSEAFNFFCEMVEKNLITWNTMIAGFGRSGPHSSLKFFCQMGSENIIPNCFTFTSVAAACADLAALSCGKQVHGAIVHRGLERNVPLANALIDMYAKCGNIGDSRTIFNEMVVRNLITWTSMMNGYGSHGYGREAIGLFNEMLDSGIKPDQIVLMGLLSACSHSGLVEEGLKYFNSLCIDTHVALNQEIYGCVVDLLGRAGKVSEAYELIEKMPFEPDEFVWSALLGACKAHKVLYLGRLAADKILDLKPNRADTFLVLSNIYAAEGKWGDFAKVRKLMRGVWSKKEAGRSWIEVKNQVYSFVVGDNMYAADMHLVYEELELLVLHMKDAVYVPDTDSLLHDFEDGT